MGDARDRARTAAPGGDTRSRTYVDADGQCWVVFEQPFSEYDRRRGCSLIFSCDIAVRRVRSYPSDWFTLSDLALAALSWGM